jgi:restriction system protein
MDLRITTWKPWPEEDGATIHEAVCSEGCGFRLVLQDGWDRDTHAYFAGGDEPVDQTLELAALEVFGRAALLLSAVIVPGDRTSEGQLVEAVTVPWFEIISLLTRDPSLAFQIGPRKWEEIIAGAYKTAGFEEVTLTPRSGDLGRDVIAVKRGIGTVRIIDQVKAYKPGHLVAANDVRALLGVLEGDKASKGFLTTTSDFAPRLADDILLRPFMPARLELVNGRALLARLKELAVRRPNRD